MAQEVDSDDGKVEKRDLVDEFIECADKLMAHYDSRGIEFNTIAQLIFSCWSYELELHKAVNRLSFKEFKEAVEQGQSQTSRGRPSWMP